MRSSPIAFLASIIFLAGCAKKDNEIPEIRTNINEEKIDSVNYCLEIDRRAFMGVSEADAKKALSGDGAMAVAIANAFADANHVTEARFWYQIAAENGNAIGMSNFSILVRDFDCHRANYWLRKALDTDGLGEKSKASMKRSLEAYVISCK